MRSRFFLFLVALLSSFPGSGVAFAAPLPGESLAEFRLLVLSLVNESRAEAGLPALTMHEGIERVAQAHAEDTAAHFDASDAEHREQSYLGHTSSDGRALNARFRDAGVDTGWEFAENAGYWIRSPFGDTLGASRFGLQTIHAGMMAEVPPHDGHREAILGNYTHIGIGITLLAEENPEGNALFLITDFSRYGPEQADQSGVPNLHLPGNRSLPRHPLPTHGGPFLDVSPKHPQVGAITLMQEKGIIQGYDNGTFRPERAVNRAEMLKMLLDAAGFSPIGREFYQCFADVFNQWFAPYVCVAKREGWVTGYPDDSFRPAQFVTRAEAITLLTRVFAIPPWEDFPVAFDDVPANSWFADSVRRAASASLLPFPGPRFLPERAMRRGEVAAMLAKALE